jgi:DNA-binding PadR family transcriptional regulator
MDKPMHGYEINQLIRGAAIDAWLNVSMPSIYYSLNKLREKGLIAETRHRNEGSPTKSIYRLTDEGRARFFTAMEESLASHEKMYFDYDLGIFLLNKLPRERVVPLLEQRRAFLDDWHTSLQEQIARIEGDSLYPLRQAILNHLASHVHLESHWLEGLIQQIQGEEEMPPGAGMGLMTLTGDLRDYPLPDLIRLIASGKHSGTLTVSDGSARRTITFHEGRPICATSRYLHPTADTAQTRDWQILIDIYELFRWQEGSFTFDQAIGPEEGCLDLRMSVEELILEGSRWVDNWSTIQKFVPSADAIFEVYRPLETFPDLELSPLERQVLACVDGLKDVSAIAQQSEVTVFETSKALYCLTAVGLVRTGDLGKIRLRRVFREIAELLCRSTIPWRSSPTDRVCEEEVNQRSEHLPLRLSDGRIEDRTDPHLRTDELVRFYQSFLSIQLEVISRRFGRDNARRAFEQVLRQLAPEMQEVSVRYGFESLIN